MLVHQDGSRHVWFVGTSGQYEMCGHSELYAELPHALQRRFCIYFPRG